MTVTLAINIALVVLCLAVMVQAFRLDRRIRALRDGQLDQAVESLENATHQARLVLTDLKRVLTSEASAQGEIIHIARELREELTVMIGIGNSVAERIVEASDRSRTPPPAGRGAAQVPPAPIVFDEPEPALRIPDPLPDAAQVGEDGRDLRSIVFSLNARRGNRVA